MERIAKTVVQWAQSDAQFGPAFVSGDDFTLVFENSIFVIAPSVMLLLGCPFYIYYYWKTPRKADKSWLLRLKQVSTGFGCQSLIL